MGSQIVITFPDLDFAGVVMELLKLMTTATVSAIALGLSIWAFLYINRKFKSMGRD